MLTSPVIKKDCAMKGTVYSVTLHLIIQVKTMTQKYYYYGIPTRLIKKQYYKNNMFRRLALSSPSGI